MRIGFLINQLDTRGTGNAVLAYAKYNKSILGNESYIFTTPWGNHELEGRELFQTWPIYPLEHEGEVDMLYHIKSGYDDGFRPHTGIPYLVHSVFDYQPHGDKYAMISQWLGEQHGAPWVPHIIDLSEHSDNYRTEFGIPDSAVVFGRHGAADTFDIGFAWSAIETALKLNPNIYFVFLNTNIPDDGFKHERAFFLPKTIDPYLKRKFLNTCDAMVHARSRGETFGLSVGEFAVLDKQIITYNSRERAHIEGGTYIYNNEEELIEALSIDWHSQKPWINSKYKQYTPEKVMGRFEEVFLNA